MDIKDEIINFIERKEETGALLITGKWGSGKTFYIKNLVDELNKEKKEYLSVISLFGIDSVENLTKAVKECYLEANSTIFTKTARKIGKIVGKTVNSGLKVAEAATGGECCCFSCSKRFFICYFARLIRFYFCEKLYWTRKIEKEVCSCF